MLSNFQHKIIGSTLHHISTYWELLNRAHNIADRDRRLATSFIAYRHRNNHIVLHRVFKIVDRRLVMSFIASPISQSLPCSFIYGRCLGSDMLLKFHHKSYRVRSSSHIGIAKNILCYIGYPKFADCRLSYDIHHIADSAIISSHFYANVTSLNLRCAFCDMGSTM